MLSSMKNALATARSRLPSLGGLLRLGAKWTSPKDGVRSVLAWRSCRPISSATLGKKAHFCDRHHIASATAALTSHSSVPRMRCSRSMVSSQTQPRQRGASLRSYVGDREHSGGHRYHPTIGWGDGWGEDGGEWLMNNVLSLQLARERAWRLRGGSKRRSLERLEAENAQLRRSVVELLLQIQALRDGAGTLRAYDAASHRRDVP
jgi:hypothetical protein